ncbi:HlyD family type I secretion periplasmic adaptor subunit [Labrenzia sp. PHM005]|uniref:HlyD family type I secretion periplasmic adaptor subunit n=1 Tax=Labrenzia sp. PHM005 TaxID=2590016 RepID=UPI00143D7841|nr:HlyD family type I secretion periplasmic adaptor subunit [Labrenzia sp. PHM005]
MKSKRKASANPRPFIIAGYATILLTFGVVGAWAAIAKLDKAVIAPGMVEVEANRREVQHLEGGIIKKKDIKEGQVVKAGDVLIELNDVQARANVQVVTIRLRIAEAVEARLKAERNLDEKIEFSASLLADKTPEVVDAVADQERIFNDRTSILKSQADILTNRIEQLKREKIGLGEQKEAFIRRAEILLGRLDRLKEGLESGSIQKNLYATYEDEYVEIKANVARMDTEEAKVEKSIGETKFQMLQTRQEFRERASTEYKEIYGQIQEFREQQKVAQDVLDRTKIRAPIDGVAQNIKLTGYVIQRGQTLLEIVPDTDEMIINARVQPLDIDSVTEGLEAEVKFTSFPSRFMPIITGKVQTVSKGTITPEDTREAPYYLARVQVSKDELPEDVRGRLSAGMPADVLITSGERTVVDYIISPLTDAVWKSMRED